jgi:hypothetical protein
MKFQEGLFMARHKSNKQNDSSYQSVSLWISFFVSMISLGIVVWNRRSIIRDDSSVVVSVTLSALTYQLTGNSAASLLTLSSWPLFFATPVAAQYSALQTALPEFRVNTYIPLQQAYPRSARLKNGEFIIAWNSNAQDGSSWGVYAQRYANNGSTLGDEFRVNNFTQDNQSQPWAAGFEDGGFIIVWHSFLQDGSDFGVYGRIYASDASPATDEFLINMQTNVEQSTPFVFANTQDEFFVLWRSPGQNPPFLEVFARYYFNNGTASSNEFQLTNYLGGHQTDADGARLSNDCWVVAWHSTTQDGSSYGVYAKIFTAHMTTLEPEFRVNQFTLNAQLAPAVIHFQNDFVVFFMSQGPESVIDYSSNHAVYGRRFSDNGTALGDEFRISFRTLSQYNRVSAAVLNQDYFVVIWKAYGNMTGNFDVYGRICHRDGNCISTEFRLNSYPSYSDSSGGEVTALSNTSFVVTYDGRGHDPDGSDGVYARIITLYDLKITLPTPSPTPLPTPQSVSTSEPIISNIVTAVSSASTEKATNDVGSSLSNNNPVPNNDPNLGAYIGGAAAGGFCLAACLGAIGFYAYRKKSSINQSTNAELNKGDIALQDKNKASDREEQSDRVVAVRPNYSQIDEVKKTQNEYDRPTTLKLN